MRLVFPNYRLPKSTDSFSMIIPSHPVLQFIRQYVDFPDQLWNRMEPLWAVRTYPPKTHILRAGQRCDQVYFLESGLLHYYVLHKGSASTKFFTVAPYCFTSQRSFNQQIPAQEFIETIETSRVWQLSRAEVYAWLTEPQWADFVRALTQEVQFFTENILEDLQTKTAEVRYREMVRAGDPLLRRVPQKILASYLGIAPPSLSRIRHKLRRPQFNN